MVRYSHPELLALTLAVIVLAALSYHIYTTDSLYIAPKAEHPKSKPSSDPKIVLVTGAAGFIGHALCKALKQQNPDSVVVGLDDFNDYYDVRLKIDRAYDLHKSGVILYNDDACNVDLLEDLFTTYNFTHVAHLAAQAGVRYSLENPQAYIHSNVECQLAVMDVVKNYPHIRFTYASSSSVYGNEAAIPFTLSAYIDRPNNMYAATKTTNELMSYHYCYHYGLRSVGLRFFTVYGPWGRPDMAVMLFAEAIYKGTKVPMYFVSDEEPLGRDFTYIDDIIAGVTASLDYSPAECGEKYNLGYGATVSVKKLVEYLEEETGVQAQVDKLPLPPTEIIQTWADLTTSQAILGFKPKTSLRDGVKKFISWYTEYMSTRATEEASDDVPEQDRWYAELVRDRIDRHEQYQRNMDERMRERRQRELEHERKLFKEWMHSNHLDLPEIRKTTFTKYENRNSAGNDITYLPRLRGNVEWLEENCHQIEDCVAFTTEGYLKSGIDAPEDWQHEEAVDLYVADLDVCNAGLAQCSPHAKCITDTTLPVRYVCQCFFGYQGDGQECLPVVTEDDVIKNGGSDVMQSHIVHAYSLYNISQMKQDADMYYFRGVYSPGGGYQVVTADTHTLPALCKHHPLCVGVTSQGEMKLQIQPQNNWISTDKEEGLYVFDIDYCTLSDVSCPQYSTCQRLGPADYRCVCDDVTISAHGACWLKPPIRIDLGGGYTASDGLTSSLDTPTRIVIDEYS